MVYYFAYGSNMSPVQMQSRCQGARPVGTARLDHWRFLITRRGTANIRPCVDARVFGIVWRLEPRHLAILDRWEGVRWRNFRRTFVQVHLVNGRKVTAVVYVSLRHLPGIPRTNYMLTALLPGAISFKLPAQVIDELRSWLPLRPIGEKRNRYVGRR